MVHGALSHTAGYVLWFPGNEATRRAAVMTSAIVEADWRSWPCPSAAVKVGMARAASTETRDRATTSSIRVSARGRQARRVRVADMGPTVTRRRAAARTSWMVAAERRLTTVGPMELLVLAVVVLAVAIVGALLLRRKVPGEQSGVDCEESSELSPVALGDASAGNARADANLCADPPRRIPGRDRDVAPHLDGTQVTIDEFAAILQAAEGPAAREAAFARLAAAHARTATTPLSRGAGSGSGDDPAPVIVLADPKSVRDQRRASARAARMAQSAAARERRALARAEAAASKTARRAARKSSPADLVSGAAALPAGALAPSDVASTGESHGGPSPDRGPAGGGAGAGAGAGPSTVAPLQPTKDQGDAVAAPSARADRTARHAAAASERRANAAQGRQLRADARAAATSARHAARHAGRHPEEASAFDPDRSDHEERPHSPHTPSSDTTPAEAGAALSPIPVPDLFAGGPSGDRPTDGRPNGDARDGSDLEETRAGARAKRRAADRRDAKRAGRRRESGDTAAAADGAAAADVDSTVPATVGSTVVVPTAASGDAPTAELVPVGGLDRATDRATDRAAARATAAASRAAVRAARADIRRATAEAKGQARLDKQQARDDAAAKKSTAKAVVLEAQAQAAYQESARKRAAGEVEISRLQAFLFPKLSGATPPRRAGSRKARRTERDAITEVVVDGVLQRTTAPAQVDPATGRTIDLDTVAFLDDEGATAARLRPGPSTTPTGDRGDDIHPLPVGGGTPNADRHAAAEDAALAKEQKRMDRVSARAAKAETRVQVRALRVERRVDAADERQAAAQRKKDDRAAAAAARQATTTTTRTKQRQIRQGRELGKAQEGAARRDLSLARRGDKVGFLTVLRARRLGIDLSAPEQHDSFGGTATASVPTPPATGRPAVRDFDWEAAGLPEPVPYQE